MLSESEYGRRGVGEMIQPYWSKKVIPRLLHHLQLKVTTDALIYEPVIRFFIFVYLIHL